MSRSTMTDLFHRAGELVAPSSIFAHERRYCERYKGRYKRYFERYIRRFFAGGDG